MRLRRSEAPRSNIDYLASLAEGAGDSLAAALRIGLAAMAPEEQVAAVRDIIDHSSPEVRIAAYSGGLTAEELQAAWAATQAAERRPKLVQALVEYGRAKRVVDLSRIPADTELFIGVHPKWRARRITDPHKALAESDGRRYSRYRALGKGAFELMGDEYFYSQTDLEADARSFEPGTTVRFSGGQDSEPDKENTLAAFGRPLHVWVGSDAEPMAFLSVIEPGSADRSPERSTTAVLTSLQLDGVHAFME
jgi:pimeloyl-ACP methyl ester carboxylesterase